MRIVVARAFLVIILGVASTPRLSGQWEPLKTNAVQLFEVTKKEFVVRGSSLAKVEIRAFSTGTEITESTLLGEGKRVTPAGRDEIWTMPLPSAPERDFVVAEIFVEAFNAKGKTVGRKDLDCHGALYVGRAPESCGKWIDEKDSGEHYSYFLDQEFDILLPPEKYPQAELSVACTPGGALSLAPPVPWQDFEGVYTVRYGTVHKGNCTITDRDFKVFVSVVPIVQSR